MKQMIADSRFVARSSKEAKIKSWLNPPDPSTNRNKAQEQHHQGTGAWFLHNDIYMKWKEGKQHNTLWLHGIPGCGKTVLSSTVIEDLETNFSTSSSIVLYFYFDFNDSNKQSFEKMVRSLAFQLYQLHENVRKYIDELHTVCKSGNEQPRSSSLVSVLDTMLANVDDVWIVLDALDECETRRELLSWLPSLERGGVHVFLTSRKEDDIETSLTNKWRQTPAIVPIQQSSVDHDIRQVVRSRIAEDEELQRWKDKPEVCEEIETKLMAKADGM
jgi:Cdc6-like AAA superfamily ATPase